MNDAPLPLPSTRMRGDHALTLRVLHDPGGRVAASVYHVTGYPETFVIDYAGRILERVVGPAEWDSPEWQTRFRGLLGEPPNPR